MKIPRAMFAAVLLAAIVALVVPQTSALAAAPAATTQQVVITEAQINGSYWVTNPAHRYATNRHVTLGDGLVTISETLSYPNQKSYEVVTTWKPSISSGSVLSFGFQSVTINGKATTPGERAKWEWSHHRYMVRDAIRDYVRRQVHGAFKYTAISVAPGQFTITVSVAS